MRMRAWGNWAFLTCMGTATGWALNCQTPPSSHRAVGMGEDCSTCHMDEFQSATQPLHVGVISNNCGECHSNTSWAPARGSNHSWPLNGAHTAVACNACHIGEPPVYEGTPTGCLDCHQADLAVAIEPSHADFSNDCSTCHGTSAWQPAGIVHEWPLEGAHLSATCSSCHVGEPPVYDGTPDTCIGCHQSERSSVVEPSHEGFSEDCGTCHTAVAWQPADFPEHEWPLEGVHANTTCASCHVGEPPVYDGTPDTCIGCHQSERSTVVQPSHEGFSEDCSTCHTAFAWQPADFPAHEWPLEGAHATATCLSCHGDPAVYDGTPTACVSCHEQDRAGVTEPPHDGFSSECQTCHGTASWDSADFAHTTFPLTGAHQSVECSSCHTGTPTVFAGTARECVGCHQADYDGSPFPGHSDFATTCQTCHTTTGWVPATGGNHPQQRFSITGTHNFACNECHNPSLGPNGAGNADCVGCHLGEHSLARMDAEHRGEVGNYPTGANRAPNFCLQCHPGGRE